MGTAYSNLPDEFGYLTFLTNNHCTAGGQISTRDLLRTRGPLESRITQPSTTCVRELFKSNINSMINTNKCNWKWYKQSYILPPSFDYNIVMIFILVIQISISFRQLHLKTSLDKRLQPSPRQFWWLSPQRMIQGGCLNQQSPGTCH